MALNVDFAALKVPLGWDQVSLGWTKGSAFGIRQDPQGPGPAVRRGMRCPPQPHETGRGRPVFGKQQAARQESRNVTEIVFRIWDTAPGYTHPYYTTRRRLFPTEYLKIQDSFTTSSPKIVEFAQTPFTKSIGWIIIYNTLS